MLFLIQINHYITKFHIHLLYFHLYQDYNKLLFIIIIIILNTQI